MACPIWYVALEVDELHTSIQFDLDIVYCDPKSIGVSKKSIKCDLITAMYGYWPQGWSTWPQGWSTWPALLPGRKVLVSGFWPQYSSV